jgi:hypothetical protein
MLLFVFCATQVYNVHGTPARSKITIDARFEIIFDDDFPDFGDATNCTQNSSAKNQKHPISTAVTNATSTTTAGLFRCPGFGVFADPTDCRNYYNCKDISNPKLRTCSSPRKFDPNIPGCSPYFLC